METVIAFLTLPWVKVRRDEFEMTSIERDIGATMQSCSHLLRINPADLARSEGIELRFLRAMNLLDFLPWLHPGIHSLRNAGPGPWPKPKLTSKMGDATTAGKRKPPTQRCKASQNRRFDLLLM